MHVHVCVMNSSPTQKKKKKLPFLMLYQPQPASDHSHLFLTCPVAATVTDWLCRLWQAMTGHLPVVSVAALLAAVRCAPSDLAQTQAGSAAQHLGSVSDCPGQPANTTIRCLRASRNPGVISFFTTNFTIIIIYLTLRPLGETARVEDCQGHDSQ